MNKLSFLSKKITLFLKENTLLLSTLFLLAFIPLYPKLPLLDIVNTWVYIRVEDFVVLAVLSIWAIFLIKKKVTLKSPLTIPILGFWAIGAISTIHGIIIIFPTTANIFPNVSFLNFLRHIEYLSLFFVAFAGIRDKNSLKIVITVLVLTLLGVIFYGFGQRYIGFPAFLTGNEEFAKGIPIQLSALSRVPSTFAGHYDLGGYLVLVVPIIASLIFGFKNWFLRILFGITVLLGTVLMVMTVSRISFFSLFIGLMLVLLFLKRKLFLYSLPVLVVFGFIFLSFQSSLLDRFGSTVKEVDVIVDAKTGNAIGHVNFVPREYFRDKSILNQRDSLDAQTQALSKVDEDSGVAASISAFLLYSNLPDEIPLVVDVNVSTGESLPQGTGYVNLSLSPVTRELGNFYYELTTNNKSPESADVLVVHGDYLVKRAAAYDLSFTTRFQGEWPNVLNAFEKNIFFGSGYGSVGLAVDNNYLRILGETGLLGMLSFISIFLVFGIYIKRVLPNIDSKIAKNFVLGFSAGVIGLAINATLIDVFEASKIAFVLWILVGITIGVLLLYRKEELNLLKELLRTLFSPLAMIIYFLVLAFVIFSPSLSSYFVGDDFTWFRWVSDCNILHGAKTCPSFFARVFDYFTSAEGFFYRPGTRIYFLLMYSVFWLNQVVFHSVSIFLHFTVASLFFLLSRKILGNNLLAALGAVLFIVMSGYTEIVLWTSATGHLFNAVFILSAVLLFIKWEEKRRIYYLIASLISIFLSLLFHELGVVAPLLIVAYKFYQQDSFNVRQLIKRFDYYLLFIPVGMYLIMRLIAQSHWLGGDYNYSIINLPFNLIGNIFGYVTLTILGPMALPIYQILRDTFRENILISSGLGIILVFIAFYLYRTFGSKIDRETRRIIVFGLSFFVISLLPFIALGNITSRYSYLGSLGLIIILVYFIKKFYRYLLIYGKEIAIGVIIISVSIFVLLHIIQAQQLRMDWDTAGDKVKKFFVSIDDAYSDRWLDSSSELHFVNVPIKHNNAWIFPVGLEDAVWLAFKNDDLRVFMHKDREAALNAAGTSETSWVLEFQDDGSVVQIQKKVVVDSQDE